MTGFKNFAVVGAGLLGGPVTEELLKLKSNGAVGKVVLLTRPVRTWGSSPGSCFPDET